MTLWPLSSSIGKSRSPENLSFNFCTNFFESSWLSMLSVMFCTFFFLFFRQKIFQLAELFGAVGSPVASIEYQHKGFLAANGGKGDFLSVHILQGEVGCPVSNFDSFEVCRFQVHPVFRT